MTQHLSRYRVLEMFAESVVKLELGDKDNIEAAFTRIKRQAKKALNHRAPPRNENLEQARKKAVASTKRKAAEFRAFIMPMIKDAQKEGCVSTRQIAEWLNKKGYSTSRGFAWSSGSVHRIITAAD
ncbi:recombinase family protein [Bradyrhizobium sp. 179]|uniref:recombinase family protein n=1 Tax=Bradyrhizobium sp. 179 TaxID=2782648 RepID=UPI001FF9A249|nr:recombinase family protein [Bradyrhizobium sp. 179]MCK1543369.1 recombinase family protein [Bradyrhizobium sp. 179]